MDGVKFNSVSLFTEVDFDIDNERKKIYICCK